MKKNKLFLLAALIATTTALSGCTRGGGEESGEEEDEKITVNFYADFNQMADGNIFATQTIDNNSKLKKPDNPTALSPEFTNFLGWSYKEIIDDPKDLWNFDTDKVNTEEAVFNMFGIWVFENA